MNILKKTFILFCLAAVSLNTVQPIDVAAADKASRKNRERKPKKGSQEVIVGAFIVFVGLIFFYKYKNIGTTNDESTTQNSNQPDTSTSRTDRPLNRNSNQSPPIISETGKSSNKGSNSGVSTTIKPLNGNPNQPDASISGKDKGSISGAGTTGEPLNENLNKPDASISGTDRPSNQNQTNVSSPSSALPPQQKEILVANDVLGYVYLIDQHNKRMLGFGKKVRDVKLSPYGNKILTVDDKNVKVCTFDSAKSPIEQKEIKESAGLKKPIAWNPKNENEFIAVRGKKIVWFDIESNTHSEIDTGQKNGIDRYGINRLNFSPDGQYILGTTMAKESQIFIYGKKEKKLIYNKEYGSYVSDIQWDSKQKYIAIAGDDNKVQIYEFIQNDIVLEKVHETEGDGAVFSVSWSPDGTRLAFNTAQNLYIATWNPPKNDKNPSLKYRIFYSKNSGDILRTITWSSDGQDLAFSQGNDIFVCKNLMSIKNQDQIRKENRLLSRLACDYLAYGFVNDTSKWPEVEFIQDSGI